jgi:photosystem II stability/assembly factor-like uncharacterized protein
MVIVLAAVLTAAGIIWQRTRSVTSVTELERIIAENEPTDHVHAVAGGPGGTVYVGSHLGVLARQGAGHWQRLPGSTADVMTLAPAGGDTLYVGGPGIGVERYDGGKLDPLLKGNVTALAVTPRNPARVFAWVAGAGVQQSTDRGQTWSKLSELGTAEVYTLAVSPDPDAMLAAGGLNGFIALSADGGKTWSFPPSLGRSVSALAFDPARSGRLWAAAGGLLQYSDDQGATWHPVTPKQAEGRTVVSLAFQQGSTSGLVAVTPEGFFFAVP